MKADQPPAGGEFGDLLRRHRLMAGLSQEELAERSGLSVRTIANMERGRTARPYRQSIRSLADALELPQSQREHLVRASRMNPGAGLDPGPDELRAAATAGVVGRAEAAPTIVPMGVKYSLPPDTETFTGRDGELDRMIAALTEAARANGIVDGVVAMRAICGMPGVGKTALAVHAAHLVANRFPDRQLFVDLHGHTPGRDPVAPGDALADLLAAVGVDPQHMPASLDSRSALWRDKMAGQKALLVLDNAASSSQVAPLLPGSGGCLVLVTSRRHLADLPGVVEPLLLEVLPPQQAQEMFVRLAPRALIDPAAVAELAALAGYLPLAISLLARVYARHPTWTLQDLVAETQAKLLTLTAEHASVAAAFEVSCQHLEPAWRRFFQCLGLHLGTSVDAYSAAALAGVAPEEAARLLDRLHAEGLLTETGHRRYGMHDLIRRFAADRVAGTMTTEERQAALTRLLDYYQHAAVCAKAQLPRRAGTMPVADPAVAPRAVPPLANADQALSWARAERSALLACLDLVTKARQSARVVALTDGMAELLRRDGPWEEAGTRHAAAIQAARDIGDRSGEAGALLDLGQLRQLTGDYPSATQLLAEALGIFRDLGNWSGQATALHILGLVRLLTSEYPAATELLAGALAIFRDLGDRLGQAAVLHRLSEAKMLTEDYSAEAALLGEALGIFRDLGDRLGQASALIRLQDALVRTGDYNGAAEVIAEALAIYSDLDHQTGQAHALLRLGYVQLETGSYLAAAANLNRALTIYRAFGHRIFQANTLTFLGDMRRRTGDFAGAAEALTEALATFRDLGQKLGEANALSILGDVRLSDGDREGAARLLALALAIHRDTGSRLGQAITLTYLGRLHRLSADYSAAGQHLTQAMEFCRHLSYRAGEAEVLNETGTLHHVRGDLASAAGCHQQALHLARQIGMPTEEARALAGLGRCARTARDHAVASACLTQAQAILQRIDAAEAARLAAEVSALTMAETPAVMPVADLGRSPR